MVYLKKGMEEGRLDIAHDLELILEINLEKMELTQTGQMKFSNPDGTHDDRL